VAAGDAAARVGVFDAFMAVPARLRRFVESRTRFRAPRFERPSPEETSLMASADELRQAITSNREKLSEAVREAHPASAPKSRKPTQERWSAKAWTISVPMLDVPPVM